MMAFAKALPNVASLIADLIAKNQDWPGAEEMATRLAKAVPANLLTPEQKDVPPQVQAILSHMEQQVKQLMTERQAMMKALTDQSDERRLQQDKINKDYEAKILKIAADLEKNLHQSMGTQIGELITVTQALHQSLQKGGIAAPAVPAPATGGSPTGPTSPAGSPPPMA